MESKYWTLFNYFNLIHKLTRVRNLMSLLMIRKSSTYSLMKKSVKSTYAWARVYGFNFTALIKHAKWYTSQADKLMKWRYAIASAKFLGLTNWTNGEKGTKRPNKARTNGAMYPSNGRDCRPVSHDEEALHRASQHSTPNGAILRQGYLYSRFWFFCFSLSILWQDPRQVDPPARR